MYSSTNAHRAGRCMTKRVRKQVLDGHESHPHLADHGSMHALMLLRREGE